MFRNTVFTTWLPILTICPVNNLPDLVYVEVEHATDDPKDFKELYSVRREIRKAALKGGRKKFMEKVAEDVLAAFPWARKVTVRLCFNKHVVTLDNFPKFYFDDDLIKDTQIALL